MNSSGRWVTDRSRLDPDIVLRQETAGQLLDIARKVTTVPRLPIKVDILGSAVRKVDAVTRLGPLEPKLQLHVVPPLPRVQLLCGVGLQTVLRHGVKDVKENFDGEL